MFDILLCSGKRAGTPFYLQGIREALYSLEELCYAIRTYAFLLEEEDLSPELASWLERECDLPSLAEEMRELLFREGGPGQTADLLLSYTGAYDREELEEVRSILERGRGRSRLEKQVLRAEFFLREGADQAALGVYEDIKGQDPPAALLAQILNQEGQALARLFRYEEAAECFLASYEYRKDPGTGKYLLAARRFCQSDRAYVDGIAGDSETYGDSLLLERQRKEAMEAYERSPESYRLHVLKTYRETGNMADYDRELEDLLSEMRQSYRRVYDAGMVK